MLNLILAERSFDRKKEEKNEKAHDVFFGSGFFGYLGGRLYGEARDGLGPARRAPTE